VIEIQAKRQVDRLELMNSSKVTAIRDGQEVTIEAEQILLDDIIILSTGQSVPVDGRVRAGKVDVNESLLNGEPDEVIKGIRAEILSGSIVSSGNCRLQVTAVGEQANINIMSKGAKQFSAPKSQILKGIKTYILIATIIIIVAVFALLMIQMDGNLANIKEVFNKDNAKDFGIVPLLGAIIGVLPSGLVLLTSFALTLSVVKLGKKNVLVQGLYCIEMLARVDVICLDKTGTITDGTMSVVETRFYIDNLESFNIKQKMSNFLCATEDDNQTAQAIEKQWGKAKRFKHYGVIPFSSSRKYSAVSFSENETLILGAPEFIDKEINKTLSNDVNNYSKLGYRVLLLAQSNHQIKNDKIGGEIKPICLIVIKDNIRPATPKILKFFQENGVKIKVISGDAPLTVSEIARVAGVPDAKKYISMENIKESDLKKKVEQMTVFGRVKPDQKQMIIRALKENGHTVAMTGDGVNDVLALKEADCSIAMGNGTQAAKNASQIVLLDSDFSYVPTIVAEGRRVINNISKAASLFITKNLFCFFILLVVIVLNLIGVKYNFGDTIGHNELMPPLFPMEPAQLSLIDMFIIGFPSIFLALSQNRKKIEGSFMVNVLSNAIPGALVIGINAIIIYSLARIPPIELTSGDLFYPGIAPSHISTLVTISTAITCIYLLGKVLLPINVPKLILFLGIVGIVSSFIVLSSVYPGVKILGVWNFKFEHLAVPSDIILLVGLAFAISVLMIFTTGAFVKLGKRFIETQWAPGVKKSFFSFLSVRVKETRQEWIERKRKAQQEDVEWYTKDWDNK
ncbi:MAG: HAD-IC family P-type ATPase, partial [Bacillales bacterium]|nr:HAD-IC family P-type ATPase [Bacillales bacterium]